MPLKVIVVGAGIAGLCTATALRQAGHEVWIFEKSAFAAEIGAALALTPNGALVLSRLGFSFSRARAVKISKWDTVRGDNMDPLASVDLSLAEKRFGAAAWTVHRVDLHAELLRLATAEDGPGTPAKLRLSFEVVSALPAGSITLHDGSVHTANLVVAADGLHSVLRRVVLGREIAPPVPTGLSAFRFLIETETLEKDEKLASFLKAKSPGATILADVKETTSERHIIWYGCRDGKTQNFVGVHPTRKEDLEDLKTDMKTLMLAEFSHFDPNIVDIIAQSSHVKCWPLFIHDSLPTWVNDKIVLVGDAAHPMLPFGGQGSNQAIEDSAALGYVLKGAENPADISGRLSLFEKVRKDRATRVQILSKVRAGREQEVEKELQKYADPPGSPVPTTMQGRTMHDYSFNVFNKCREICEF